MCILTIDDSDYLKLNRGSMCYMTCLLVRYLEKGERETHSLSQISFPVQLMARPNNVVSFVRKVIIHSNVLSVYRIYTHLAKLNRM